MCVKPVHSLFLTISVRCDGRSDKRNQAKNRRRLNVPSEAVTNSKAWVGIKNFLIQKPKIYFCLNPRFKPRTSCCNWTCSPLDQQGHYGHRFIILKVQYLPTSGASSNLTAFHWNCVLAKNSMSSPVCHEWHESQWRENTRQFPFRLAFRCRVSTIRL